MTDAEDRPLIVRLSCGHSRPLADPETFSPHRVVPYEGGWAVRSDGSWCAACVAAGRAPDGMGWREAWDEVARRRSGHIASNEPL